jgi:aspartyl/asparaginyl-tRNA synthetase
MIDYKKIVDAAHFYKWSGFNQLEAPWFISRKAMEVTAPVGRRYCTSFLGDLVASGEQSFIQMWLDNNLKKGKWFCITPCFRDEPKLDEIHLNYFIKLELIEVDPGEEALDKMVNSALQFFNSYIDSVVIDTNLGKDIVSSTGIELGSYGFRNYKDFHWLYGTGVAEPRLSYAESLESEYVNII